MIDFDLLKTYLQNELNARKLSARAAAERIGCSPATLGRLLKGSSADSTPDMRTVLQAVSWLGRGIEEFRVGSRPQETNLAEVEVHLRALTGLTDPDKEALVRIVKSAHDAFVQRSETK